MIRSINTCLISYRGKHFIPPTIDSVIFIGYTEFARREGKDVHMHSQKVDSFDEFEHIFGGAPSLSLSVHLNEKNQVKHHTIRNNYFLYESVRLYFLNGGQHCTIISVASYDQTVIAGDNEQGLRAGLKALSPDDDSTLLLLPDMAAIENNTASFEEFKQSLHVFCNNHQNYILLQDIKSPPVNSCYDDQASIEQDLTHSIVCTPWVNSDFPVAIPFHLLKLNRLGTPISLRALDPSDELTELFDELDEVSDNIRRVDSAIKRRRAGESTLMQRYQILLSNYLSQTTFSEESPHLRMLFTFLKGLAEDINNWICNCAISLVVNGDLRSIIQQTIIPDIATEGLPTLIQLHRQAILEGMVEAPVVGYREMFCVASCNGNASPWRESDDGAATINISPTPGENTAFFNHIFDHFNEAINLVRELNTHFENDIRSALLSKSAVLQKLYITLQNSHYIPSSGVIAAIYSQATANGNDDIHTVPIHGINGLYEPSSSLHKIDSLNAGVIEIQNT